ncbi:MAG: hydrolase [Microbacteriaceae bacterium]|nr:hydrolase [Microbacteriaceae bacterium]
MPHWICLACAVEHPETPDPPLECAICLDERQYVPRSGQAWTSLERMSADGVAIELSEAEPNLFGISTSPQVGIGQRSLLITTTEGNVLWDPVGFVDAASAEKVRRLGPVVAIVASHPHMFGAQVSWSRALGDPPVYVAEADRDWVRRPDAVIRFWRDELEVVTGITIRAIGGHFPGSAIAYWRDGADGRGVALSGDTIFPGPSGKWVTFMRSFPNQIPMSAAVVDRVATSANAHPYDRMYGNFGNVIDADAMAVVRRSADRYMSWVSGEFDVLT